MTAPQDPRSPEQGPPPPAPQGWPAPPAGQQPPGWGPPQQPAGWGPPTGQQPAGWGPPPGQQPPGWGQQPGGPPWGQPGYPRPTNTLAIVTLVLIFVFTPAALVTGIIARRQIKQTGEAGDGMALAGVILGAVTIALVVLAIAFVLVLAIGFAGSVDEILDELEPSPLTPALLLPWWRWRS